MYFCAKEIRNYHNEAVTLPSAERSNMKERRDVNRKRLELGLKKNEEPKAIGQWTQGSYAMRTMIQDCNNKYDIDDGVYFSRDSLKGVEGADKTALNARHMVRDAVDDGSFKTPPKIKKNCVRIYYDAGYHVDIPVYRKWDVVDVFGETVTYIQLASADWKDSNPKGVTVWFNDLVKEMSPDDDNEQFRRIVRLLKKFTHSRESWADRCPSGFTISKLASETFVAVSGDDEQSLHKTMVSLKSRLDADLSVEHPVVNEWLADSDDPKTKFFKDKLKENLGYLNVLNNPDVTKSEALRAWKRVFNDEFFEKLAAAEEESSSVSNVSGLAALSVGMISTDKLEAAVDKEGGGRFG